MRGELVGKLPPEAFSRGIGKLKERTLSQGVVILGFDTEYESQGEHRIVSYQLSLGESGIPSTLPGAELREEMFRESCLLECEKDLSWKELAEWVRCCLKSWGYSLQKISHIVLVSHFSTAELSHLENFWQDATVRRVSSAQVYNASYKVNNHQKLTVMDNYHFWNVGNNGNASLMAVAAKFGEQKLDYDTSKVTRKTLRDPVFRVYALWDAVLCARVFNKFRARLWQDHQVDVLQYPTSASLAMAVYRQHFLPESFAAPESRVRRQGWLSLWGGRAEAYVQGDHYGDYTLRDVTSLYPMSERLLNELPTANDWIERPAPKSWKGLCRVQFKFPAGIRYPCLPVFHDEKLIFPREGVSDCSLAEAQIADELGCELKFLKCFEYDRGDTSLTDFMQHFMKQKAEFDQEGQWHDGKWVPCSHASACECDMLDSVGRELAKLMMNSLIGKLSQNKGDVDIEAAKAFAAKEGYPLEVVLSVSFNHPDKPKALPRIGGHIMPEWSALILGKARSIMAVLLNGVDKSFICSTDSLLIPTELNPLIDALMKKLGIELTNKNKGKKTHRVRVVRNRVYAAETKTGELIFGASHAIHLGNKRRDCGACERGDCREPTHNAWRFIMSSERAYKRTRRFGLKTAIKTGKKFFGDEECPACLGTGEDHRCVMVFEREWDQKRLLHPDGSTRPWVNVDEYDLVVKKSSSARTPKVTA